MAKAAAALGVEKGPDIRPAKVVAFLVGVTFAIVGLVILFGGAGTAQPPLGFTESCGSVWHAWTQGPTDYSNLASCEQRRHSRAVLAVTFLIIGGVAEVVSVKLPKQPAEQPVTLTAEVRPPKRAKTGPPVDQRPPRGWWWDGSKWNPPADG